MWTGEEEEEDDVILLLYGIGHPRKVNFSSVSLFFYPRQR
ncbi:hypothetical protein LEP1GSC199_2052 [Leptospira vanthielii serovar Holland str. Waz Holland = ATCC 700522]|uniref:Uncharacterized protein n=1 Tax=Leptospira vanthielii serovar Holland str. Waz Holland = ATCC 700522 TaxID=1218591 RepID=N1WCE9_9LEPT|nr:hypothetical protein LEP1GSC199_2052 [Leptospira vanthielii serovar Holland str. Waz Holland = ATCC 700522]